MRTALVIAQAPVEAEADRERHADHQRWNGEDGLHESMLTGGLGLSSTAAPGDRPDAAGRAATYFSFSMSSFPSFSESACLPSLWSLWTSATLALASAAAGSKRFAVAALIWAMSFGHWLAGA